MSSSVSLFLLSFSISLFTSLVETAAIALQNTTYLNQNCNDSIKSKILRFKIFSYNAVQFVLLILSNQPDVVDLFTPVQIPNNLWSLFFSLFQTAGFYILKLTMLSSFVFFKIISLLLNHKLIKR